MKRDNEKVVLLPRDPRTAYVYWDVAEAGAKVVLEAMLPEGVEVVDSFVVDEAKGGRFVRYGRPGVPHRCRVEAPSQTVQTAWSQAPREAPGEEPPAFVALEISKDGVLLEPTKHHDPLRGEFPGAAVKPRDTRPTSASHTSSGVRR